MYGPGTSPGRDPIHKALDDPSLFPSTYPPPLLLGSNITENPMTLTETKLLHSPQNPHLLHHFQAPFRHFLKPPPLVRQHPEPCRCNGSEWYAFYRNYSPFCFSSEPRPEPDLRAPPPPPPPPPHPIPLTPIQAE
ncbi:unnamed protein product [Gadus morhua 'NCC']